MAAAVLLAGVGTRSAAADPGGVSNLNACTGQAIALLARQGQSGEGLGKVNVQDLSFTRYVQQLCAAGYSPELVVQKVREAAWSA